MRLSKLLILCPTVAMLAACPPPPASGPTGPGGGGTADGPRRTNKVNPPACGKIDATPVGRKIHAFLVASAELDQATWELEQGVYKACRDMANTLGVSTAGDTATLCDRVAKELEANLEVSVSQETRLVTKTEPPVCETKVDFAASVAAECEAKVDVDIDVRCDGYCSGSCAGVCQGNCATTGAGGQCAGACDGVCEGRCSGGCNGHADVDASAECRAAAEIRANIRTECSEPKVVVVRENVTVVDSTKLDKAIAAIELGMPSILKAGAKAKIVAEAAVDWAKTAASLVAAGISVLKEIGEAGVCVAAEVVAAAAATANISARIDVSVQVSARFSASAGSQ